MPTVMTAPSTATLSRPLAAGGYDRGVQGWLFGVAALVFVMVIVGGATRLTNSGLSITEWQPLLGALPPMGDAAWAEAFAKYREIPQYRLMNQGMSLEAFKFIYWWEWGHRLLGRVIGAAFLLPFLYFLARGRTPRAAVPRFVALFLLGALQGVVGWWMVASGLVDRTEVAPYRLATHLTLAAFIFAALIWTALSLAPAAVRRPEPPRVRAGAMVIVGLVFLQIFLGGLVAGNDAGLVYNTWPDMNGRVLPDGPLALVPAWRNLFENHGLVQFLHRMGAYAIAAAVSVQLFAALRGTVNLAVRSSAGMLAGLVALQVVVGIATLLVLPNLSDMVHYPLWLALGHQGLAMLVLAAAVMQLRAVRHPD